MDCVLMLTPFDPSDSRMHVGQATKESKLVPRVRQSLSAIIAQSMLVFLILNVPAIGYCNSESNWFMKLFESERTNMKGVATKETTLDAGRAEVHGLDFSPDGKYLAASATNNTRIQIWDWRAKRIVRTLERAHGANEGLTTEPLKYSPDGRFLAACSNRAQNDVVVQIWDTATWAVVRELKEPLGGGGCEAIGFSPDQKLFFRILGRNLTKPGDSFIVYDTNTWQPIWGLRIDPFYPNVMAISPDGQSVAVGGAVRNPKSWPFATPVPTFGTPPLFDQAVIIIVDLARQDIVRTIQKTVDFSFGRLAWSPDGAFIAAIGSRPINAFAYGSLESHMGAGEDTFMMFEANTGKKVAAEQMMEGHMLLRFTPDGRYLIESNTNTPRDGWGTRIWDGQHQKVLQEIPSEPISLAVSRDSQFLAMGSLGKILVWNLK